MSSSQQQQRSSKSSSSKTGMDMLLTVQGKGLKIGDEIRFTLVKSSWKSESADPINPKAPPETFPLVAKFPESVVKPDFRRFERFYQQDIPKQKVKD